MHIVFVCAHKNSKIFVDAHVNSNFSAYIAIILIKIPIIFYMITIKDIAKEAKVSEGTIDRVIHNRGGVSKKTEAKVKKILERHNFKVNPVASALALKNKYTIAALIPQHNDSDLFWQSPNLGMIKGAEHVQNFGVQVNRFTYNQYDRKSYLATFESLIKTTPSAVILVPNFLRETKNIVSELESLNIPYLFLNIDIDGFKNVSYVGQDSHMAGYMAGKLMCLSIAKPANFLIIQARHNITKNKSVSERILGFNDYFIKNNISFQSQNLKLDNLENSQINRNKINSYLEKKPEINGLYVPSSRIHMVVECLEDKHIQNLELIGFDNTPQNITCLHDNSVSFLISQKPFDQGYDSVVLMSEFLMGNTVISSKTYMPIEILTKENVIYNVRSHYEYDLTKNI